MRGQEGLRRAAHGAVRLIPDVPMTVQVKGVGPLRIRLRRHRWFFWEDFAKNDALILGIFARLIRPGDVVYDIGANIGLYTRLMRVWFGASRVIAFEPMRENFDLLQRNVALGRMEGEVDVHAVALSDVEGQEELQVDDMASGTAVLSSVSGGEASAGRRVFGLGPKSERVEVARLDQFIEAHDLPRPQMMKVDTEGAEVKVLRGAVETLRQHRPRLAIALHGVDKAKGVLSLLDELGYFSFGFVREGESGPRTYRQIWAADADSMCDNNMVASCEVADVREEIEPYARRSGEGAAR